MEVSSTMYFRRHPFVWSCPLTKGRWCRCLLSPLSDRIRDLCSISRFNQFSDVHLWIFLLLQLCRRKFNDGGIQYLEHVDTDDHMKVCTKTSCLYTQLNVFIVVLVLSCKLELWRYAKLITLCHNSFQCGAENLETTIIQRWLCKYCVCFWCKFIVG